MTELALLQELQAYVDERARRWSMVRGEPGPDDAEAVRLGHMMEALAIGQQVARLIKRKS